MLMLFSAINKLRIYFWFCISLGKVFLVSVTCISVLYMYPIYQFTGINIMLVFSTHPQHLLNQQAIQMWNHSFK